MCLGVYVWGKATRRVGEVSEGKVWVVVAEGKVWGMKPHGRGEGKDASQQ